MTRRTKLNREERFEVGRIIREKTGYTIKSRKILEQIFRRSSFAAETGEKSNEIFEFIGDQVLSFFVVKLVSERCGSLGLTDGYSFRIRENRFTQIKQELVNNEALARIIDEWDIAQYLLLGRSDVKNEVIKETKVKADLLEAVIGAVAVESNWDPEILESAVSKVLEIDEAIKAMIESDTKASCFGINNDIDKAITALKELAENGQCKMPEYEFTGPDLLGYDADGNPKWFCSCRIIDEVGRVKMVEATSKKEAKKAAAYLVLCELTGMQNEHGPNDDFCIFWTYKNGKLLPNRTDKEA